MNHVPAATAGRHRLHKLQATGNDFLVCDPAETGASAGAFTAPVAAALCDRRLGIGADGLIVLGPPRDDACDVAMVLRNSDGGTAEMSGNGIRALAWLAHRLGYGDDRRVVVETAAGRRSVDLRLDPAGHDVAYARVGMGPVTFDPAAIPVDAPSAFGIEASVGGTGYEGDAAGMGNPHLVLIVDDPGAVPVTEHGPALEADPRFPRRTNVEFVAPVHDRGGAIEMRVWERGVGETLSCGTGACAAAAVACRRGLVGDEVEVRVRGGELAVDLSDPAEVRLAGPVVHVFDTAVDLSRFGAGVGAPAVGQEVRS